MPITQPRLVVIAITCALTVRSTMHGAMKLTEKGSFTADIASGSNRAERALPEGSALSA